MTTELVVKASNMKKELEEAKEEFNRWSKLRDKYEKLADEFERDRNSGSYRYQNSIEDLIDRAKALEKSYLKVQEDVLINFD